ncbi:MAG: thermonuclease family protein [Candidatus Shapirobacteria bacterium]
MIKRIVIIVGLVILIFAFGFWAENKIKEINFEKIKQEIVLPTPGIKEKVKVSRVIDGDTIELSDKRKVRYIGINSPEMTDKRLEVKCLAQKAKEADQKLVENKEIELEKDVSETDKYGRLLRYVWIDGKMINEELMKSGWTEVDTYPPDIKYQELFVNEEKEARLNKLGIWGDICQ